MKPTSLMMPPRPPAKRRAQKEESFPINGKSPGANGTTVHTGHAVPAKPNFAPRNGALKTAKRVLFVTDFYIEELLAGVVEHARQAGWELITNMRFHGRFPSEKVADGIIGTVTTERVQDWLKGWKDVPIVQMYSSTTGVPYPLVEPDYMALGRVGAEHLLELGHVHFAMYWLEHFRESDLLVQAFARTVLGAGRTMHHLDFPAAYPGRPLDTILREERLEWLARQLVALPKPIAIMGDDDRRALELLAACQRVGLRVPDDVAILGCENRQIELGVAPLPISSLDLDHRRIGREAAELLERLMAGGTPPASPIMVPPLGVVARQSTATFITDSPGITASLLHVREHFHRPLRLSGLARLAGMSERVFESEFKRCVGRSARAEIQRARMACATRLLRDTDLKLDAIAVESGFGSAKRLCGVFSQTHGVTPNGWRQKVRTGTIDADGTPAAQAARPSK
jgi:LacI family transcriptional regulator